MVDQGQAGEARVRGVGRGFGPLPALAALLLLAAAGGLHAADAPAGKPPFHTLYSNDTTNLEACISPYHAKGQPFTPAMLEASVDEAAQADVQLIQPGLIWVPLWQSALYPPAEHFRWWQENFPRSSLPAIPRYVANGGDIVKVFTERCRAKGVSPFVSVRLNDYHGLEWIDAGPQDRVPNFFAMTMDRFRREHPEYRLTPPDQLKEGASVFQKRDASVMNWAEPAVRERMLGFIGELCANYDIDGIELDFLRHFRLFGKDTPEAERAAIMADFVGQVRRKLDATTPEGRHRWLAVRIPAAAEARRALGIDPTALSAAGVEMFTLSSNYYTVQDVDVAGFRQLVPDSAGVYLEMTHSTVVGADPNKKSGDSNYYRRTTDEQLLTSAALATYRGADGVSLFNFAYYREYGSKPERGPFREPSFDLIPRLGDRAALAEGPRHYFLAPVWRSPYGNAVQLPRRLRPGQPVSLTLDTLAAPDASATAKLRLQSDCPLDGTVTARFNGQALTPLADTSEPFPNPDTAMLGTADTLRAWSVPASLLKDGPNTLEFTLEGGAPAQIVFVDLALDPGIPD